MFNLFKTKKNQTKKIDIKEDSIVEDFENVDPISYYIKENVGIDFEKQKPILKSKLSLFCKKNNIYNFEDCLDKIKTDDVFKQNIINHLTTNESFFYRELNQITSLVDKVFSAQNNVNILCAPSANGEEPYSIVIALLEANVSKDKFKITGIDISSDAIQKSLIGKYNGNSVRNLSESILNKYFTKTDNFYTLNSEIIQQVTFKCVNIFDNNFKDIGEFDYIFSRNMLIYFDKETRIKAKNIFTKLLKNESESIFFGHADFPLANY